MDMLNNVRSYKVAELKMKRNEKLFKFNTEKKEDIIHSVRLVGVLQPFTFKKYILEDFSDVVEEIYDMEEDDELEDLDYGLQEREWLDDEDDDDRQLMIDRGFNIDQDGNFYVEIYTEIAQANLLTMTNEDCTHFYIITDMEFNIPYLGSYHVENIVEGDKKLFKISYPGRNRDSMYNKFYTKSRERKIDIGKEKSTEEISNRILEVQNSYGVDLNNEEDKEIIKQKIKDRLKFLDIRDEKVSNSILKTFSESKIDTLEMAIEVFKMEKLDKKLYDIIKILTKKERCKVASARL